MQSIKGKLVFKLKQGDKILFGDNIISIRKISSNFIEVYVNADKDIQVSRKHKNRDNDIMKNFLLKDKNERC